MRKHFMEYLEFLTTNLGHCATCMRISLVSAVCGWGLYGAGFLIWSGSVTHILTGLAAIALTGLWLAHIGAYTAKALNKAGNSRSTAAKISQTELAIDNIGRRNALGLMLQTAGIGMVASVPALLWPSNALAFCGQCTKDRDCGSENSGWSCKNTEAVNSGKVCNECVED